MHTSSHREMKNILNKYCRNLENITVADIGSFDVNGCYKNLIKDSWKYIGVDIAEGKNVDIVMENSKVIPLETDSIDLVISGQCIEHCKTPWILVEEMSRILKPGGLCIITAPAIWQVHRYPVDCFRYYPDGMRSLMEEACLTVIKTYVNPEKGLKRKPFGD